MDHLPSASLEEPRLSCLSSRNLSIMALVSNENFLASIQFGTIAAVGILVVATFMWIKAVRARGKEINLPTYHVPMGSDAATVIKQAHKEVYAQQMPLLILGGNNETKDSIIVP